MKKFYIIGIGLCLLGGAIIPFSSAFKKDSRYRYHAYKHGINPNLFGQNHYYKNIYKKFPQTTNNYLRKRRADKRLGLYKKKAEIKETYNKRPYSSNYSTKDRFYTINLPKRHSTYSVMPKIRYNHRNREGVTMDHTYENNELFKTYENDIFSIQLPESLVQLGAKNANYFVSPYEDFDLSIKRFDSDFCQHSPSFFTCAIQISKNLNRSAVWKQGRLLTDSRVIRQTNYSDTILDSQIQTRVYTESFKTRLFNNDEEIFINRFMVSDLNGDVYLIETRSAMDAAPYYLNISKQVFDSFRLFPIIN